MVIDGSDPVSLIGLTLALTQILKQAICGGNPELTDRYGRLIAVGVSLTLVTAHALAGETTLYQHIVTGLINGLVALGLYQSGKYLTGRRVVVKR